MITQHEHDTPMAYGSPAAIQGFISHQDADIGPFEVLDGGDSPPWDCVHIRVMDEAKTNALARVYGIDLKW